MAGRERPRATEGHRDCRRLPSTPLVAKTAVPDLTRTTPTVSSYGDAWLPSPSSTLPGSTGCNGDARKKAEDAWRRAHANYSKTVAANRNDIEHAGFRSDPLPAKAIREQLDRLIRELEVSDTSAAREVAKSAPGAGTVYFVSRHPGAREWAANKGFHVDCQLEHLDPQRLVAGDIVIGSLPVNLAAEVCRRGARHHHLSLELPRELRGAELSAAQMRDLGARIEEFHLERGGSPPNDP